MPNLLKPLLAWLLIFGLLLLKPNRSGKAWWILAPLAVVSVSTQAILDLAGLGSDSGNMFLDVIIAFSFGLAAVWLLAPFLARKHRLVTFLCFLPTMLVFSVAAFAIRQDWTDVEPSLILVQLGILLGIGTLIVGVALFLTGLVCRRRYHPMRLSLWLITMLIGVWFAIMAPFAVIVVALNGGGGAWGELVVGLFVAAGTSFAVVLPFLLLAFANSLFRDRLKQLLHVEVAAPPPAAAPPIPSIQPA
jgi:hypothetical protein